MMKWTGKVEAVESKLAGIEESATTQTAELAAAKQELTKQMAEMAERLDAALGTE
jgi:hypothetical protein